MCSTTYCAEGNIQNGPKPSSVQGAAFGHPSITSRRDHWPCSSHIASGSTSLSHDHRHQVNSYGSDHCRRMEEKRTNWECTAWLCLPWPGRLDFSYWWWFYASRLVFGFKLKLPIHLDRCWSKYIQVHLLAHHRPNKPSLTYFLWWFSNREER